MEKKGAMLISPPAAYPDPSQAYEALFGKTALRNAGKVELPGFRELLDATMAAPDQAGAQGGLRQAAAVRHRAGVAAGAVHRAGRHRRPSEGENFEDSLLAVPKFTEVWLKS